MKKTVNSYLSVGICVAFIFIFILLYLPSNEKVLERDIQRKITKFRIADIELVCCNNNSRERIYDEVLLGTWRVQSYRDCVDEIIINKRVDMQNVFLVTISTQISSARYSVQRTATIDNVTNLLVLNIPMAFKTSEAFIHVELICDETGRYMLKPLFIQQNQKLVFMKIH
jgi:hypothetical protein